MISLIVRSTDAALLIPAMNLVVVMMHTALLMWVMSRIVTIIHTASLTRGDDPDFDNNAYGIVEPG